MAHSQATPVAVYVLCYTQCKVLQQRVSLYTRDWVLHGPNVGTTRDVRRLLCAYWAGMLPHKKIDRICGVPTRSV